MNAKKEKKIAAVLIIGSFITMSTLSIPSAEYAKVENIDESLINLNIGQNNIFGDPWEVDDCFVYSLDASADWIQYLSPVTFDADFEYFNVKVTDTTDDTYILSLVGKPVGEINLGLNDFIDLPFPIELNGKIKKPTFEATLIMEKVGYSVRSFNIHLKGKMSTRFKPVPIRLSIPFDLSFGLDFNPAFTLFGFDPNIGSEWKMDVLNFDVEAKIKLFFGLISRSLSFDDATIPFFDQIVTHKCVGFEEITTEAGAFQAYIIEIVDGLITYYYSPELSNVIKIETHEDLENARIVFELISLKESYMN